MKRPKTLTKRERRTEDEAARRTKGEEHADAVRCCAMVSHVIAGHNLPALIRAAEDARRVIPIGGPALSPDIARKLEALDQDIVTLKSALPLWEHSRTVRERLKLS